MQKGPSFAVSSSVCTLCVVFTGSLFTHIMNNLEFLAMCCAQVIDGRMQTKKLSKPTTVDGHRSSGKRQRSSSLHGVSGSKGSSRKGLRPNVMGTNATDTRTQGMARSSSDQSRSSPATIGKSTDLWNRFLEMTHRMDRLEETMQTLMSKVAEGDNLIQRSDIVVERRPNKNDQLDLLVCVIGVMEQRLSTVEQSNAMTFLDQRGNLTTSGIETHLSITKSMIDYSVASQCESMNTRLAIVSNNLLLIQNRVDMIYAQPGSPLLMPLDTRMRSA